MIHVETSGSWLKLSFGFNPRILDEVKAIEGRKFDHINKTWSVPFEQKDAVDRLIVKYNKGENVAKKPEVIVSIDEMPDLEIEIPLKRELFPFQRKGVAAGLKFKRFINGDQPGLGKTTQAIATVVGADAFPTLIICPATLKENWKREFEIVAGIKAMILTDSVKNTWHKYYEAGICNVFITNYESLKKYFVETIIDQEKGIRLKNIVFKETIKLFKCVVVDELHKCKDVKTQQSKFVMGIALGKEYIIGLTGTPVVNKPKDLASQLYIIGKFAEVVEGKSYKYFMDRYCGGNGQGAYNLKELHSRLRATCFFQRQKKDVLQDLPDKMRQIILCDITTRKEYNEAIADLGNYLKEFKQKSDAEVRKSMMGEVMVKIGVCKNISARGKLNEVFEYINEVIESGEKVVVFIHQKEIAEKILNAYPKAVSIRGMDSMESRQKAIDSFQNNSNTKIIVCSIKAAGVGITLTAASRVAFVELPWHPADCDQCEDRCHRIGQKDSVQCTYFLGHDTIDEHIYKIIEDKRLIANSVTGTEDNVQREIIYRLLNLFSK